MYRVVPVTQTIPAGPHCATKHSKFESMEGLCVFLDKQGSAFNHRAFVEGRDPFMCRRHPAYELGVHQIGEDGIEILKCPPCLEETKVQESMYGSTLTNEKENG